MIIVSGAGRSGTNMMLEILRGHPLLIASMPEEDKKLFEQFYFAYPPQHLCKCDSAYIKSFNEEVVRLLECCAHARIIWMVRDLRDMAISRIYHGYKRGADDATFEGCVADLYKSTDLAKRLFKYAPQKAYLQKMEDILLDTEGSIRKVCKFLRLDFREDMIKFYTRMRNPEYEHYKEGIDKTRVNLYKNWKTLYDGFFVSSDFDIDMEKLFEFLKPLNEYFGYE